MTLGILFLSLKVAKLFAASGYTRISFQQMEAWKSEKLALFTKVSLRLKVLITQNILPLLQNGFSSACSFTYFLKVRKYIRWT